MTEREAQKEREYLEQIELAEITAENVERQELAL